MANIRILCSIPILTLNSKKNLEKILPILVENFEDVFIIDGNSTDGTQEYASSLGVRVEKQLDTNEPNQRISDFRQARLDSWSKCKYPWIFFLDSDQLPTQGAIDLVKGIVAENKMQVHKLKRNIQLPDGKIVHDTPFYGHYITLFNLNTGITLAKRKVHERFVIPPEIKVIKHDEAIICPEPEAGIMKARGRNYIKLEAESLSSITLSYLFKWILWYNIRSFFGQLLRVIKSDIKNRLTGKPTLPWKYNFVFLEYRILSMLAGIRAWRYKSEFKLKLLKRLEKYLKVDISYIAKGGFWLAGGETAVYILSLILAVAFANFISKETYGTYKYILSVMGFLGAFTLRGVDPLVTQAAALGFDGSLGQSLRLKTRYGLIGSMASILLASYYLFNGNSVLAISFLIVSAFVPLSFGIYINYLKGKRLFNISTKYTTITHTFVTLSMLATVLLFDEVLIILFVALATLAAAQIYFYTRTMKRFVLNNKSNEKLISHGKHMSATNVLDSLLGSLNDILLFHYIGPVGLAVFSIAIAPVQYLRQVSNYVVNLATPKLALRSIDEINKSFWFRTSVLTVIGVLMFVGYYFTVPYIFGWFFPKYTESIPYSQLFALVIPLALSQSILSAAISGKLLNIPKKLYYLWLIPGVITTMFILAYIQQIGVWSVVLARIFTVALAIPVSYVIWKKLKKVTFDPAINPQK